MIPKRRNLISLIFIVNCIWNDYNLKLHDLLHEKPSDNFKTLHFGK